MEGLTRKRFIISWLLSVAVMLMMSFLWHGIILNDFRNLPLEPGLFMILVCLSYLGIGLLLNVLLAYVKIEEGTLFRRMLIGGALGFFIYLIIFTLGISYHTRGMEHLIIDFSWQMIEQSIGAAVVAISYHVYGRMDAVADQH